MHEIFLKTIHHFFPELNSWVKKNSRSKAAEEDRVSAAGITLAGYFTV